MNIQIHNPDADCGRRSFNAGLRYAGLEPTDEVLNDTGLMIAKAEKLGLTVITELEVYSSRANEPVLVMYNDNLDSDVHHFVFASDIAPWLGRNVRAVIVGWEGLAEKGAQG